MTFRMGYWDCPSCGHKKNLGPHPSCAQCGRPRGPNIAFYTDDSAPMIEDPELVRRARAGADWKCKFCGADNRAGQMNCHNCGAGPDGSVNREQRFIGDPSATKPKTSPWKILGIVLGVLSVLAFGIYFLFVRTRPVEVVIDSMTWTKSRELVRREMVEHSGWKEDVPNGATTVRTETKPHSRQVQEGTKKKKVGKKDLGNGMFEDIYKEEPQYVTKDVPDTWVTYKVEERRVDKVLTEKTEDGKEPPDPTPSTVPSGAELGEFKNTLELSLKGSNGKRYGFDVDLEKLGGSAAKKYAVGKKFTAQITTAGGVKSIEPL